VSDLLCKSKESYLNSLEEKFDRERLNLDIRIEETKKEKLSEFESKKKVLSKYNIQII
jgi:hypothetical protein